MRTCIDGLRKAVSLVMRGPRNRLIVGDVDLAASCVADACGSRHHGGTRVTDALHVCGSRIDVPCSGDAAM